MKAFWFPLFSLLFPLYSSAQAGSRVAPRHREWTYESAKLANPTNDAAPVAASLTKDGFRVI